MTIGGAALNERLLEMAATSELLAGSGGLNSVLNGLAERAKAVTNADYAAISTFDENDVMERFIYNGIDERLAQRLGHPPVGRGLLGDLVRSEVPVRIDDLAVHPSFTGWPQGHPDMAIFLGVPIRAGGRTIGSLYMTRERGKAPFSADDEMAGVVLGLQAAVSLAAALAQDRTGRIVLLEERVRIAHDLHDGMIQTLYALGLEFDATARLAEVPEVRSTLQNGVARVNELISDLRQYIMALEAEMPISTPDLSRDLPFAVRQVVPAGIDTVVNLSAPALHEISNRDAEDILYLAREALSNAVRHGQPSKVAVDLRQDTEATALTIQDNGSGFDQAHARQGFGMVTMKTRAERLGAELTILGIPGMGTTVRLLVPRRLLDD
jgi:signal transduction histidine kinase